MKICYVASSGGHWEELMALSEIFKKYEGFFVTEIGGQAIDSNMDNIYLVPQTNRHEIAIVIKMIKLFAKALVVIMKEKPDVVLTTGALISFPFCVIAKLLRKKVIFIESFARVDNKSLTGKLVYPFADVFIVQWETMKKCYNKAIYGGTVF